MQSFLVTAKDKNKASSYISNFLKEKKIDPFDISLHSFEKAVGIEDVRNIQKTVILKPFKGKVKAVIIQTYANITTEAQNALLKVLEEPPANTIIIIATSRKELLLPTIISRCKIIELKQEIQSLSKQELLSSKDILVYLQSKEIGGKLKLAQDLAKNKDDVIPWLEKIIIVARETLIDSVCHYEGTKRLKDMRSFSNAHDDNGKTSQYLNTLISLTKIYTILKTTNVNPRIILENLFLNL